MRLLRLNDNGELSLPEYFGKDIPRYAVLSHTWGADHDEVNYKDIRKGRGKNKAGYNKIRFCGKQAAIDGLEHFWIDTCCIDKSSSAELSEAINSMFRWYHDAAKCYVYLSDVSVGDSIISGLSSQWKWKPAFQRSRWFTRGWTLQELIAPECVEFFSAEGERLGNRTSLLGEIHKITRINVKALQGSPLSQFSVDERMLWAERRETKREEDAAYSLLGLFDIHMPLIYGEGREKAFIRLHKEIKETTTKHPESARPKKESVQPQKVKKKRKPRTESNIHEDGWESVTEDDASDASSASSGLGFGEYNWGKSQELESSDTSGTSKWGWLWGSKGKKRQTSNFDDTYSIRNRGGDNNIDPPPGPASSVASNNLATFNARDSMPITQYPHRPGYSTPTGPMTFSEVSSQPLQPSHLVQFQCAYEEQPSHLPYRANSSPVRGHWKNDDDAFAQSSTSVRATTTATAMNVDRPLSSYIDELLKMTEKQAEEEGNRGRDRQHREEGAREEVEQRAREERQHEKAKHRAREERQRERFSGYDSVRDQTRQLEQQQPAIRHVEPSKVAHDYVGDDIFDSSLFKNRKTQSSYRTVFQDWETRYNEKPVSQADFFAPKALLEQSDTSPKTDPNEDATDIHVCQDHDDFDHMHWRAPPYALSYTLDATREDHAQSFPWRIPTLNLIQPTPPESRADSIHSV
jgi:flagellin-like hook-associated protein FlgL